ncbi:MAG: hypothetical protein OXU20_41870 [Myxococcales bacterium]|nr:hypothetical protein [Myxococcales bacterium]
MVRIRHYHLLPVKDKTKHGFLVGSPPHVVFLPSGQAARDIQLGRD